ncbi:hypothetical protein GCK72_020153 [Caenorhabditis remanei]|uniref:Uncharacterized protein n=1 Tax=Caenorhabditis remanei TaxID=31234 RepID=A0A6A5GFW1_CAERE|nr:hypothetical protein GCK72_020153 [Caenorhabditis remanei]KAF1753596.1 hypothetical protein GCK72_020153 [Caenorhabditis remanei]
MSLYQVLSNNFEMSELYTCPANMSKILEPRPIIGSYFLVTGTLLIVIYLPCFIVIIRSKCRTPSYKLMLLLGIFDIMSLLIDSVATGILAIMGASFCNYPLPVFTLGALAMGSWIGCCVPSYYHNMLHTTNNLMVSASTPLYIYLCYHLIYKFGYSTSMWLYRSKQQIVIQAIILCFFHAVSAYIYVYMQFFPSPPWLILIGQLTWQWSNGCVCFAYWTLNRTIRNSAILMMFSKETRQKYGLHMGIDEQIAAERQEGTESVPNVSPGAANSAKVAPFMAEW